LKKKKKTNFTTIKRDKTLFILIFFYLWSIEIKEILVEIWNM
jgi:hypothetical protein